MWRRTVPGAVRQSRHDSLPNKDIGALSHLHGSAVVAACLHGMLVVVPLVIHEEGIGEEREGSADDQRRGMDSATGGYERKHSPSYGRRARARASRRSGNSTPIKNVEFEILKAITVAVIYPGIRISLKQCSIVRNAIWASYKPRHLCWAVSHPPQHLGPTAQPGVRMGAEPAAAAATATSARGM